jgi:hypothetical protein
MNMTNTRYELRPDIRFRRIAGDGLVVCQNAGEVLVTNAVGAEILSMIERRQDDGDMLEALADTFDADRATLKTDMERYLAELESQGVISRVAEEAGR